MNQLLLFTLDSSILINPQNNFLNYSYFLHVKMSNAIGNQ